MLCVLQNTVLTVCGCSIVTLTRVDCYLTVYEHYYLPKLTQAELRELRTPYDIHSVTHYTSFISKKSQRDKSNGLMLSSDPLTISTLDRNTATASKKYRFDHAHWSTVETNEMIYHQVSIIIVVVNSINCIRLKLVRCCKY